MGNGCNVPEESIRQCTKMIHDFLSTHEDKLCVVHCTHGYNRTGLIVCTYLNEYCGMTLNDAVSLFKEARPPVFMVTIHYSVGYLSNRNLIAVGRSVS